MTWKFALLLTLFLGSVGVTCAAGLTVYQMVEDVNRKLPQNQQFEYGYWYPGKFGRLKRLYRCPCPEGRLISRLHALMAVSGVLGLTFAWQFGFFR